LHKDLYNERIQGGHTKNNIQGKIQENAMYANNKLTDKSLKQNAEIKKVEAIGTLIAIINVDLTPKRVKFNGLG